MKLRENIRLAIILGFLILVSVAIGLWDLQPNATRLNSDLFVIENIDPIDRVVIARGEEVIDARAFSGGFMINDQFPMDENLLTVLAAVLQRVRVERPLTGPEAQGVYQRLLETGSLVEVYDGEQLILSFRAGGDEFNSYFATEEGRVYVVTLPGYTSYVSGLFELPLEKWRSRKVFANTWRSLMSFDFQDFTNPENDFQISYKDPFFVVPGVQQLDSNHVMGYLQDVVNLKASSLVDTTHQDMPWLELTTKDINPARNQTLTIYGDLDQAMVLGKVGNQYFTFQKSSIEPIIRNVSYFESQQ